MSMEAFSVLEQNALNIRLVPISIRELFFLEQVPCTIYSHQDGRFKVVLNKHHHLDKRVIKSILESGQTRLFTLHNEHMEVMRLQQDNLRAVIRSLSIGMPLEKGKKALNLLSINMSYLYRYPMDDDTLNLQYQSAKILATFLLDKPTLHEPLYLEYIKQKHHFIFAQPLLSSLFLLGVLKQSSLFSDKEIETFFLTSFFKDIGMSAIPTEKYNQEKLNEDEKKLMAGHPAHSVHILSGRIQLSPDQIKIIENHHSFSLLGQEVDNLAEGKILTGVETMLVSVMDIISAMIAGRPFRKACHLYEALGLIKMLIADQYPHEFKLIVTYFKNFFNSSGKRSDLR